MDQNLDSTPSFSPSQPEPDLSICIVTLRAKDYLRDCLESILAQTQHSYEIIVVDNNSSDGTLEMLAEFSSREEIPVLRVISNSRNLGYTMPMNQAMRQAKGRFLLQLNPDTLVLENALDKLVDFMENHPKVGICGPKVLNKDGSLQKPCRRGESRPWAVIAYFTGLANLFPQNPLFSEYYMGYKDENETHPVAGVAGSCMLIRRQVVDQIGYLDERFFAYQEDADYCLRGRMANWQVYYYPQSQVIHFGGKGGSAVEPMHSTIEWHRSYFLFYKKNYAGDYFFLFNWLYYMLMLLKLIATVAKNSLTKKPFGGSRKPG